MLLDAMENRIVLIQQRADLPGLPFKGAYLRQFAMFARKNLELFRLAWTRFDTAENWTTLVDAIIMVTRGNVTGFWAGMFLRLLKAWLLANRPLLSQGIGAGYGFDQSEVGGT